MQTFLPCREFVASARAFHRSHQAALVRKLPEHYRRLFPDVPDDLPYIWPESDRARRVPV